MRKLHTLPTLALLAVLVACEGEPPKSPATAVVGGGATPTAEPAAEPDDAAAASPAAPHAAATPANACGCCPCAMGDAGAAEGGAEVTAPAPPVVAATPTSSTISGALTMAGKALPYGVVYLEDAPIDPKAKMTARIDNRQMTFIPFVTVVPAGGKVTFSNDDPFPHNVFSPDAEKFNMGTISHGQVLVHTFPKAGAYSLLCNLHPGMLGNLVVAPSSYFAKTDAKGHYAIKEVPPGTYKITAWSPRLPTETKSVDVKGDATLDFELHR